MAAPSTVSMITLDELYKEFDKLDVTGKKDDAGWTSQELSIAWGVPQNVVTKRLRVANRLGILQVGQKKQPRIDGVVSLVPCYQILRKPPPKRRDRRQ